MIGHYLLTLTPEQEERVLTQAFEPVFPDIRQGLGLSLRWRQCGCLCLTAGIPRGVNSYFGINEAEDGRREVPGRQYEYACAKFGVERINAAIRNRILANQARRVLAGVRASQQAPA